MGRKNIYQTVKIVSLNYLTGSGEMIFTEDTAPQSRVSQMSRGLLAVHLFIYGKSTVRTSFYPKYLKTVARKKVSFHQKWRILLGYAVTMYTKLQLVANVLQVKSKLLYTEN